MWKKALEMGIFIHRGCIEQPGRGSFTGDFERWAEGSRDTYKKAL
jgi:hypothetical protein